MLKIIYIINWIVIGLLALLVGAETLFPTKGGDAAGRGIGQAIYYLAIIALIVLLMLNLLPFNWSKYVAFALILLPFVFIRLSPVISGIKSWINRKPDGINPDGTAWFQEEQKQRIAVACYNGNVEKVKKLLQEPLPGLNDPDGNSGTLLSFVISDAAHTSYKPEEKVECVRLLLAAGAKTEGKDNQENPGYFSAAAAGRPRLLRLLLEHGADPNARDHYNNRPILYEAIATYREVKETVQVLLDSGADPNAVYTDVDSVSISPLIYAAEYGRWNICPLLIEKGADINYRSSDGRTLKSLVEAADASFTGDGYSSRAEFDQVKNLVR